MKSKRTILSLSCIVPMLIVLSYFIYRGFAPFGHSSVLTVDMAQQYVDFFAYFRHTLLHDPSGFFYSFGKALGGDMLGTWSYYLMSPLNFLILLFPISKLPSVIGIITILKYGLSGLTSAILFLSLKKNVPSFSIVSFSTVYALMGWMIANQLNTIWVDGVILLPLIFLGLLKIMQDKSSLLYIVSLAAMLMINYYIGWMVAIFVTAYIVVMTLLKAYQSQSYIKTIGKWFVSSMISGALAAWILIPTYFALKSSKNNLAHSTIKWKFEFNPLKMIAKFVDGAFNFNQLPGGTANLFVGGMVVILFIYYFLNGRISGRKRIATGLLTIFFGLSLSFMPLDLLWHGMAAPVWYSFRFSFIVSFFMILIAFTALEDIVHNQIQIKQLGIALGIVAVGLAYLLLFLKKFSFLNGWKLALAVLFVALNAVLLIFAGSNLRHKKLFVYGLLAVVTLEMGSNLAMSLNSLSYLRSDDYTEFSKIMQQANQKVASSDDGLFRTEKTFSRTRNDALNSNYNGGSAFSSTLETATTHFYNNTGNPSGVYYAVYANGTTFTDSLLGMKYMYTPNEGKRKSVQRKVQEFLTPLTSRPDIEGYQTVKSTPYVNIHQNSDALPIAFMTKNQYMFPINNTGSVIDYQNQIATQLDSKIGTIMKPVNFSKIDFDNTNRVPNLQGGEIRKINPTEQASITLTIKVKKHHSYYMSLGPRMTDTLLTYRLNGKTLTQYRTSQEETLLNIATAGNQDKTVKLQILPNYRKAPLQEVSLFSADNSKVHQLATELKQSPLKITSKSNTKIAGTVNSKINGGTLATTIPYSKGWSATVDGDQVGIKKWANMFMAIPVNAGIHEVKFTYQPVGFKLGLIVSLLALVVLVLAFMWFKFRSKKLEN